MYTFFRRVWPLGLSALFGFLFALLLLLPELNAKNKSAYRILKTKMKVLEQIISFVNHFYFDQIDFDKEEKPTNPEEVALWEELDGKKTYHQWINKRRMIEGVSKSTVNGWYTKLSKLAKWKGSDYLAELTKSQAIK